MPTLNVFNLIDEVLASKTDKQEEFTAYDITQAVRSETDEEFFHDEVKQYIHDAMRELVNDGFYEKGLHALHNAIKYSPIAKPAQSNTSITQTLKDILAGKGKKAIDIVWGPNPNNPTKLDEYVVISTRDNRGRLCVPKSILAEIERTTQYLYVTKPIQAKNILKLKTYPDFSDYNLGGHTIDKSGNIRIPKTAQEAAGIKITDKVKIQRQNNQIIISKL